MTDAQAAGADGTPGSDASAASTSEADRRAAAGRRMKFVTIAAVVLLSALTFLAWSQSWGSLVLTASPTASTTLNVPGSVAAPALSALALAGIALAGALAIAGPVIRIVLGALEVVLGGSVLWSAISAMTDPVAAGASVVTTKTGVAGMASIRALVTEGPTSFWPVVAAILGGLMVVAGVMVIATVRRWPNAGRRYQTARFEGADGRQSENPADFFDDEADEDAADDAADARATATGRPDTTAEDDNPTARSDAAVDDWDSLTRGTDPTR